MSAVELDDPPVDRDAKAGFSSWCRRDQHTSCRTAGARCTCSCHGSRGQAPPAAPPRPRPIERKEGTPMPDTDTKAHLCTDPGCGRSFDTSRGLSKHRTSAHLGRGPTAQTPPQRPTKRAPAKARAAKQVAPKPPAASSNGTGTLGVHLVVVQRGDDTLICPLQTGRDAEKVLALLDRLDITAHRYEKA